MKIKNIYIVTMMYVSLAMCSSIQAEPPRCHTKKVYIIPEDILISRNGIFIKTKSDQIKINH